MKQKNKIMSAVFVTLLVLMMFSNISSNSVFFNPLISFGSADSNHANNNSSWYNSSWLNVTVESKRPRILWYDFQKCTSDGFDGGWDETDDMYIEDANWVSKRNNMTEVDNDTWYRFIINISSDQGWDNIEFINISGWHDNGSDADTDGSLTGTDGYNRSSNLGGNRNFFMYYENITGTPYFNLTYPRNNTEITIGNFSEINVTDTLGIEGQTETHNISFVFKPGYQFRYAPGPGETSEWENYTVSNSQGMPYGNGYDATTCCWESFDNPWSWNFNITVENKGENWDGAKDSDGIDRYKSWVRDEFGVYSYTEIISADNANIFGAPGERHSTNGSSWYNDLNNDDESQNVTVRTRSNGNYSMTVNLSDLQHVAVLDGIVDPTDLPASQRWDLQINNTQVYVRGGNRTESINFATDNDDETIWLYGYGDDSGTTDAWQHHEVNGTLKYTGENASDDGLTEQYPDHYDSATFNSLNIPSYTIEFACEIPDNQIAGKYATHVYYHLRTQTHN